MAILHSPKEPSCRVSNNSVFPCTHHRRWAGLQRRPCLPSQSQTVTPALACRLLSLAVAILVNDMLPEEH